ncbi:MAG TPA: hypothetical protein VF345_13710 [Chthoniobacterales bacterium]
MERKRIRKSKVRPEKKALPKIETSTVSSSVAAVSTSPGMASGTFGEEVWPSPEQLYREAEGEPNYRNLSSYSDTIGMLREKGFSYREIAEWFSERGVSVDHNAVYRTYTNSLPGDLAQKETENAAQEEHDRDRLDGVV